jgi:hypothetical protein
MYQRWAARLYGALDFNAFEAQAEKLSGTHALKVCRCVGASASEGEGGWGGGLAAGVLQLPPCARFAASEAADTRACVWCAGEAAGHARKAA